MNSRKGEAEWEIISFDRFVGVLELNMVNNKIGKSKKKKGVKSRP